MHLTYIVVMSETQWMQKPMWLSTKFHQLKENIQVNVIKSTVHFNYSNAHHVYIQDLQT